MYFVSFMFKAEGKESFSLPIMVSSLAIDYLNDYLKKAFAEVSKDEFDKFISADVDIVLVGRFTNDSDRPVLGSMKQILGNTLEIYNYEKETFL